MNRLALAVVASLAGTGAGWASGTIRCTAKGQNPVTISLDAQRFRGRPMSCISGSFVADMTPCAPAGAFSLSAPTGSAAIVAVVNRWQEYADHDGGVVSFYQTPQELAFSGGFNTPERGLVDDWNFKVDRVAGQAKLIQKGNVDVSFTCTKAVPKF